jgi:hypothetical protein
MAKFHGAEITKSAFMLLTFLAPRIDYYYCYLNSLLPKYILCLLKIYRNRTRNVRSIAMLVNVDL